MQEEWVGRRVNPGEPGWGQGDEQAQQGGAEQEGREHSNSSWKGDYLDHFEYIYSIIFNFYKVQYTHKL